MNKFELIKLKNFRKLPKTSGVYCFTGNKKILYIGKAINIQNRVKNHFQQPTYRDNLYIHTVDKIGYIKTNSEIEALILEANLIKKYQPKFNVVWRDDKNYFYVAITKNEKPVIYITHQKTNNAEYIGPFVDGTSLKNTLKYLRRVFPFYTQVKHPKLKCTWCHLDLCPGPNPNLKLYKDNIKKLVLVLKGKSTTVLNSLKKEMTSLAKQNKFEEAGKVRNTIYSLQQVMSHTNAIENPKFEIKNSKLRLAGRIECYDISNIQGKFATGSMIVFIDGKPDKNQYRKFKIKSGNTPNDIAMLKEVLERRFSHPEWKYPDIILIDGGKAQLNVAIGVKNNLQPNNYKLQAIKIISVAKGKQELFIEGEKYPIPLKDLPQKTKNLILQLDAEAHRFAISYHRFLRSKKTLLQ